jgi:hypothetical protein
MWTIGHISLGYILSRPWFGNKPLKPVSLLSIFFISVVLDGAHFYIFRTIMHNLVFFPPFTIVLLWGMYKLKIIEKFEIIPLFVAGLAHIIGDVLFGSFGVFIPITYTELGLFAWGGYLDLAVESLLAVIMFVYLFHSGDLDNLKIVKYFKQKENKAQRRFQNFILILLILAILAQIATVIYLDFLNGVNFYNYVEFNDGSMWYVSFLFMMVQIIFVYILIQWARERWRNGDLKSEIRIPKS